MKFQLSALDIYLLVRELKEFLPFRIQKIYNLERDGLEINLYSFSKKEEKNLKLIPPTYFSLGEKSSQLHQSHPSSFVMLLRKYLRNSTLMRIEQHNLERVLELIIEKNNQKFLLILEFFSKGNIFLGDENKKILGLQKWQKWKDRTLGVGKKYKYPPSFPNPFEITWPDFNEILKSSSKSLIALLVRELNLGKTFSEEISLLSKVDKEKRANELTSKEYKKIFSSLKSLLKKFQENLRPVIILKDGNNEDVIPFQLELYSGEEYEKKYFSTFHEAVNEYFGFREKKSWENKRKEKFQESLKSLEKIKENQEKVIKELKEKEVIFKEKAELIYQNLPQLEKILQLAKKTKNKEKLIGKKVGKFKIKEVKRDTLLIEV